MIKVYVPSKQPLKEVYAKSKHLAIVAHADDIEMLALRPITQRSQGFFGIVMGDNKGRPLKPEYKKVSLSKVQNIRESEQEKVARLAKYRGVAFLRLKSKDIKNVRKKEQVVKAIYELIKDMPLKEVYTHSLFDNHPTHVAVAEITIAALKKLPLANRPKAVYGMEVWGSLEWLPDRYKVAFDVSGSVAFIKKLLSFYKSQSYKGHRYDEALLARLKANAMFGKTHNFSTKKALVYGLDLLALLKKGSPSCKKYIEGIIEEFLKEKKNNLSFNKN